MSRLSIENPNTVVTDYAASLGNIKLESIIGAGGFGDVYRCETPNGKMACKFFVTADRGRIINSIDRYFLDESSVYAYLGNSVPGVCIVRELGPGYIGMCLQQGDLGSKTVKMTDVVYANARKAAPVVDKKVLDFSKNVPLPDSDYVIESMASFLTTLEILHSMNIAHFDIKAQNILLGSDGSWKLCDFGVSRKIRDEDKRRFEKARRVYLSRKVPSGSKDLINSLCVTDSNGSTNIAAPEIFYTGGNGLRPTSTISDIWSAGILFYNLLTGFEFIGTTVYHDKNGDIAIRDMLEDSYNSIRDKGPLEILRFLTRDMKRYTMDIYGGEWSTYIEDTYGPNASSSNNISSVSPFEILRIMRPDISYLHKDIWDVMVNMLDPNPLTRYTASDCLNSDLFKPFAHIRDKMWRTHARLAKNIHKIAVATNGPRDTPLMKFARVAMREDNHSWLTREMVRYPGIKRRIQRILSIVNASRRYKIINIEDVRLTFFCIYQLSFLAEYGMYVGSEIDYDPTNFIGENKRRLPPDTKSKKYTRKQTIDRINAMLYYIAVDLLKFNLWL